MCLLTLLRGVGSASGEAKRRRSEAAAATAASSKKCLPPRDDDETSRAPPKDFGSNQRFKSDVNWTIFPCNMR